MVSIARKIAHEKLRASINSRNEDILSSVAAGATFRYLAKKYETTPQTISKVFSRFSGGSKSEVRAKRESFKMSLASNTQTPEEKEYLMCCRQMEATESGINEVLSRAGEYRYLKKVR